jgi:murein DD-endopeptidase MepM/ murein hydrolase activator NlpD
MSPLPVRPALRSLRHLLPRGRHRPGHRGLGRVVALVVPTLAGFTAISGTTHASPTSGRRSCATPTAATYRVADGDNWFAIAQSVGAETRLLLAANDATAATTIHPGDVLCLTAGTVAPAANTGASCTSTSAATDTVKDGDSWFAVAERYGLTMGQLLAANHATAETPLYVDDELCLPPGATSRSDAGTQQAVHIDALPLQGPCGFGNTWRASRGNGRVHEGVDLIAAAGNYVYAVVDGTLTQRAWDQPGRLAGNAWWLTSADGSGTYFFYAHLYSFTPGLKVGSRVRAGQIIGFVGNTGNSSTSHLHFEVHPNGGDPVNPYNIVSGLGGCNRSGAYRQPSGWVPDTEGVAVD